MDQVGAKYMYITYVHTYLGLHMENLCFVTFIMILTKLWERFQFVGVNKSEVVMKQS